VDMVNTTLPHYLQVAAETNLNGRGEWIRKINYVAGMVNTTLPHNPRPAEKWACASREG